MRSFFNRRILLWEGHTRAGLEKLVDTTDWPDEKEFAFLKKRIGSLADPIGSDVILREALQFIFAGDNLSAAFLVTRSTALNVREAIDLLMKIGSEQESV